MRFLCREEVMSQRDRLVETLFADCNLCHCDVEFFSLDGNDLTVFCNGTRKMHAYIDDFEVHELTKNITNSMKSKRNLESTRKLIKFMTELFGKEYVDAYENWVEHMDVVAELSLAAAKKLQEEELRDFINTINGLVYKKYSKEEFETKRASIVEEAKQNYMIAKQNAIETLKKELKVQKEEALQNLEVLRRMLKLKE